MFWSADGFGYGFALALNGSAVAPATASALGATIGSSTSAYPGPRSKLFAGARHTWGGWALGLLVGGGVGGFASLAPVRPCSLPRKRYAHGVAVPAHAGPVGPGWPQRFAQGLRPGIASRTRARILYPLRVKMRGQQNAPGGGKAFWSRQKFYNIVTKT